MSANFKKITIGRDGKCQVVINENSVSRLHAELFVDNEGNAFLTDMNSSNGTTVNGSRITETVQLKRGDVVMLGKASFAWENELNFKSTIAPNPGAAPIDHGPRPSVIKEKNNQTLYIVLAAVLFVGILTAGLVIYMSGDNEENADTKDECKATITKAEILEGKAKKGDICCECNDGKIETIKDQKVTIEDTEVVKIEEINTETKTEVKPEGNTETKTEVKSETKSETKTEVKTETKETKDLKHGYKEGGKWIAGEDDNGVSAMAAHMSLSENRTITAEAVRRANDMNGSDPIIKPGQAYIIPKK